MTSQVNTENIADNEQEKEVVVVTLRNSFSWLDKAFSEKFKKATREFLNLDLNFKLIGSSYDSPKHWKGNDFFVTQIGFAPELGITYKIADDAANIVLSKSLGKREGEDNYLELKEITEIEAHILTSYNEFLFKKAETLLLSQEETISLLPYVNEIKYFYLTFCIFTPDGEEAGKILFSFPCFVLRDLAPVGSPEEPVNINYLNESIIDVGFEVGKTKAALEDIKQIEPQDVVMLEQSDLYSLVLKGDRGIKINVNPNQSLLMDIDQEHGDEAVDDMNQMNTNIWDSLEVDVTASFDRVKMKLGDLKQITEGLVLDVASLSNNKLFLEVEGKQLAAGELVIIGDKYAVKVTEVYKEARAASLRQAPEMMIEQPYPQQYPEQYQQPHPQYQQNPQQMPQQPYPAEYQQPAQMPVPPEHAGQVPEGMHQAMPQADAQMNEEIDDSDFDFSDYEVENDV